MDKFIPYVVFVNDPMDLVLHQAERKRECFTPERKPKQKEVGKNNLNIYADMSE